MIGISELDKDAAEVRDAIADATDREILALAFICSGDPEALSAATDEQVDLIQRLALVKIKELVLAAGRFAAG